jgi:hypothetical protein
VGLVRHEPRERGRQDVWRDYLTWDQNVAEFGRALARHAAATPCVRQLYRPATTPVDQSTVTGP